MEQPTYYTIDEDGYLTGQRLAQRDPRESNRAGEDMWMAPGRGEAPMPAPPEPGANQVLRWVNGRWTVEDDFRGETWYADWETEVVIDKPGTPAGLYRTRQDLPLDNLKATGQERLFNWAYFEKYGDHKPLNVDGVELWADPISMNQALVELEYARVTPGYSNVNGWKGKNGELPLNSENDVRKIVLAYRERASEVHNTYQLKKAELAAETDQQAAYLKVKAIFDDLEASGGWDV